MCKLSCIDQVPLDKRPIGHIFLSFQLIRWDPFSTCHIYVVNVYKIYFKFASQKNLKYDQGITMQPCEITLSGVVSH